MSKLIMCKGLSASGKTSWAREQVLASKGSIKMVEKDRLREMMDAGQWSGANEKTVVAMRDAIIEEALRRGHSIICSDTNLDSKHETRLRQLAAQHGASFEVKDFTDVPLEVCLKRDAKRANYVGEKVIVDQWRKYLAPKPPTREYDVTLPDAVLVDLDGTLAIHAGRGPYDFEKCVNDLPNKELIRLLRYLSESVCYNRPALQVIAMSGRPDSYRLQTEEWLRGNQVPYDVLYMRLADDQRKDTIVKRELFEKYVENEANVIGVWDDRPSVIRMWRSLGLPTFDVAGSVEF